MLLYIDSTACTINSRNQKGIAKWASNTGDVIIEEDAIYGDSVNLASLIESLAVPGGIFISEKVHDEIKNHSSFSSREMGYRFPSGSLLWLMRWLAGLRRQRCKVHELDVCTFSWHFMLLPVAVGENNQRRC